MLSTTHPPNLNYFQKISKSEFFINFTLGAIVLNALFMGIETFPGLVASSPQFFWILHVAFQIIFCAEILIRILACAPRMSRFFTNPWNLFDFFIVAFSLIPSAGPLATVARLARVLRIARLMSAVPELRLIVGTMLKSIPSLVHVVSLMGLIMYIYAIVGFYKFSAIDPENWGHLGLAFKTLFQILTLDDWANLQKSVSESLPWAWVFFYSYTVLAVFVVVNLFIAVVTNNLELSKKEIAEAALPKESKQNIKRRIAALREELNEIEKLV